jgi:hypothetical protein
LNFFQRNVFELFSKEHLIRETETRGPLEIYCCSNAVNETVVTILKNLGIHRYFRGIYSSDMVAHAKPHPEIYQRCCYEVKLNPQEVMICEDSPVGRQAAMDSGCHVCPVAEPSELSISFLEKYLNHFNRLRKRQLTHRRQIPWIMSPRMNVVYLAAGLGSRFAKTHSDLIKPLIPVRENMTMIQMVIRNIDINGNHIFLFQEKDIVKFGLKHVIPAYLFTSSSPSSLPAAVASERQDLCEKVCKIVSVNGLTTGAAATALLAKPALNVDEPLLLVNSDQFVVICFLDFFFHFV